MENQLWKYKGGGGGWKHSLALLLNSEKDNKDAILPMKTLQLARVVFYAVYVLNGLLYPG